VWCVCVCSVLPRVSEKTEKIQTDFIVNKLVLNGWNPHYWYEIKSKSVQADLEIQSSFTNWRNEHL